MVLGAAWGGRLPVTQYNQEGSNPFKTAKYRIVEELVASPVLGTGAYAGSSPVYPTLAIVVTRFEMKSNIGTAIPTK